MGLAPSTISAANLPVQLTPHLGGEVVVYISTLPAGVRGMYQNIDGTNFEHTIYATALRAGCTAAAVVGPYGLADGTQAGSATEGEVSTPFGARGDIMYAVDIPSVVDFGTTDTWTAIGCTTERRITIPSQTPKAIPCGMIGSKWVTRGRTKIGEVSVTCWNRSYIGGLLKAAGTRCTLMLVVRRESTLETARVFLSDCFLGVDANDPDGDAESTLTASGQFTVHSIFPAEVGT